jgi:ribonuclease HI
VEEAEARACLERLQHITELQRFPGIIETDCQRVVQAVSSWYQTDLHHGASRWK